MVDNLHRSALIVHSLSANSASVECRLARFCRLSLHKKNNKRRKKSFRLSKMPLTQNVGLYTLFYNLLPNFECYLFLRATACNAFARLSYRLGVCPSVRHTLQPYQNGASKDHEIFTVGCHQESVLCDKISCR